MQNENSYAELTRAYKNGKKQDKFVQSIYIDLLIQEALLKDKSEKIKKKIDKALDNNDKEAFLSLSRQLIAIEEKLNA